MLAASDTFLAAHGQKELAKASDEHASCCVSQRKRQVAKGMNLQLEHAERERLAKNGGIVEVTKGPQEVAKARHAKNVVLRFFPVPPFLRQAAGL